MRICPRCRRLLDDGVRFCSFDGAETNTAVDDAFVGQQLGGEFELHEVCGRGATGTVYRAYQRQMDRWVALKLMRPELIGDGDMKRRFFREARTAARLCHPNIVTMHLIGENSEGLPYLVMEYLEGMSLEAICEAQGIQPLARLVHVGRQVAAALQEAHQAGVVHRDLKPANIILSDRGRVRDFVKVLDFGIAKLLRPTDQSMLTVDGSVFGTPHYIAPEQASGGAIDHRVDLYSLGVILFRLATGVLPFEAPSSMQVVLRHLREPPPRPRALNPAIPEALEALLLACLEKRPADRPRDAEEVLSQLEPFDDRTYWSGTSTTSRKIVPGRSTAARIGRTLLALSGAVVLGGGLGAVAGIGRRHLEAPPMVVRPVITRPTPPVFSPPVAQTALPRTPAAKTSHPATRVRPPSPRERSNGGLPHHRSDELPVTVVPPETQPLEPSRPRPLDGRVVAPARVDSPSTSPVFRTEPLPPDE